ncbi:MAG TPA: hypothetical protein VEB68_08500 [Croceibacterium sp.]|nr:hypothetical protein [Croceibacterium sp.]
MTKHTPLLLSLALVACSGGQAQDNAAAPSGDFSSAIALRDASECRFDALTEHAFEGLLLLGGDPDDAISAPVVAIGEARLAPQSKRAPMEGMPDGYVYTAHVDLPANSTWHGLKIERLWVEFVAPPETDSLYRRGIRFAASPEEVREVLAAQGAEVPVAPKYSGLFEYAAFTAGTCGGGIFIERDSDGASLVCERGC